MAYLVLTMTFTSYNIMFILDKLNPIPELESSLTSILSELNSLLNVTLEDFPDAQATAMIIGDRKYSTIVAKVQEHKLYISTIISNLSALRIETDVIDDKVSRTLYLVPAYGYRNIHSH